jgi:hypothetical protein
LKMKKNLSRYSPVVYRKDKHPRAGWLEKDDCKIFEIVV